METSLVSIPDYVWVCLLTFFRLSIEVPVLSQVHSQESRESVWAGVLQRCLILQGQSSHVCPNMRVCVSWSISREVLIALYVRRRNQPIKISWVLTIWPENPEISV